MTVVLAFKGLKQEERHNFEVSHRYKIYDIRQTEEGREEKGRDPEDVVCIWCVSLCYLVLMAFTHRRHVSPLLPDSDGLHPQKTCVPSATWFWWPSPTEDICPSATLFWWPSPTEDMCPPATWFWWPSHTHYCSTHSLNSPMNHILLKIWS